MINFFRQLKGEQFATLDKPPNNTLFDAISAPSLSKQSPLLQRRLELAAEKNKAAAPQVHINIPPELFGVLRPPAAAIANPPPSSTTLIPGHLRPGPDMSVDDFCALYDLDTDIADRFKQNKYKRTQTFQFIEVPELKEMGFVGGEIAELKVAITRWGLVPE